MTPGAILTAIDFFAGILFERQAQYEADGKFVVNAQGVISVELGNRNGEAGNTFVQTMNALLEQTQKQAQALGERSGQEMGVIAERLPVIFFKQDAMFLHYKDPFTGQQFTRTFSLDGKYLTPGYVESAVFPGGGIYLSPWGSSPSNPFTGRNVDPADRQANGYTNQVANGDNFFDSLAQQFSDAVTASGAIAPLWEMAAAHLHEDDNLSTRGVSDLEQVGNHFHYQKRSCIRHKNLDYSGKSCFKTAKEGKGELKSACDRPESSR